MESEAVSNDTDRILRILKSIDDVPVRQFWALVDPPPPSDIGNCVVGKESVDFARLLWTTNQDDICRTIEASLQRVREAKEVVGRSTSVFDSGRSRRHGDGVMEAGIACTHALAQLELYLTVYLEMWKSPKAALDRLHHGPAPHSWPHRLPPRLPMGAIALASDYLGRNMERATDNAMVVELDKIGLAMRKYALRLNGGVEVPPEILRRLGIPSASDSGSMQAKLGDHGALTLPKIANVTQSQRRAVVAPLEAASALRQAKHCATTRRWTLVARAALMYSFLAASFAMIIEQRASSHYLHMTAAACVAAIAWSAAINTKVKHELDGYVGGPDGAMVTAWRRFYVTIGILTAAYLVVVFANIVFANNRAIHDAESAARYRVCSAIAICVIAFSSRPGQTHHGGGGG
jgi:hypothetical protein